MKIGLFEWRFSGLVLLFSLLSGILFAGDLFEQGEAAFLNNDPGTAVTYLEPLAQQNSSDNRVYLYLGIAMQQLGRYQKAVEVFNLGIQNGIPPYDKFYYNMGNNYFLQQQNEAAERAFSKAIEQNSGLTEAVLNRANTRMRLEKYVTALGDYQLYLLQEENSPQKETIQDLIDRVQAFLAEKERIRQDEEARRAAEAERQRALLASVLSSLENADDDTVNMKAESEDIETFDMELDIED